MAENLLTKFKEWLGRQTEACRSVAPLFSHAMDRRLTWRERLRVRLHLFTCGACLNYISNLEFMREVFRAQEHDFAREKSRERLAPEAADRIKHALEAAKREG